MTFTFDHCWENGAYGAETKKDEEPNPDTGWYNIIKEFIILIGLSLLIVSIMKKYYKIQKL
jgi:hypothetical protein